MKLIELKRLFDVKSTKLEVFNYKRDEAIMAAFQLFEMNLWKLRNINYVHPIWKRERIYDLEESLALIIEWIYRYGVVGLIVCQYLSRDCRPLCQNFFKKEPTASLTMLKWSKKLSALKNYKGKGHLPLLLAGPENKRPL